MTPRTLLARVDSLTESITYEAFNYVRRGTFERHKLIVATMLTFRINIRKGLIDPKEVDALIKKEVAMEPPTQTESVKFIPETAWAAVKGLESVKLFENLISSMEAEALQWRKWFSSERAEIEELPRAFKDLGLFHRMLLLRAMRPDRLNGALTIYVEQSMGIDYVQQESFDIFQLYAETNTVTPVFFVLFPGVDPTPDVEKIGRAAGKGYDDGTFINISMGQGQEEGAIKVLHDAGKTGKWAMFQNVHLMQAWMKDFERHLEMVIEEGAHPEFRVFVSSEPPPLLGDQEIIPEFILQNAIKVANEAPQDLKSNMRRCFSKFDEDHFEKAKGHKLSEFKALLFGLCMFHSLIVGRKKFGSQGWSRNYNFNDGDLTICGDVLHNYLTKYEKVPYADLAYIYGEIMYGGHITDNWDRRTNNTYLEVLIRPEILQQMQLTLAPGFKSPDPMKFDREAYRKYIEEKLPPEEPKMFGLHPNAEIGYLTTQGESLFGTIAAVSGGSGGAGGDTTKVKSLIASFTEQLPPEFNMLDIMGKTKERSPYIIVCFQECERMNFLTKEIKTSLFELDAGLKGQLNITDAMEATSASLNLNKVPDSWVPVAYFSNKTLIDWFADLLIRIQQLQDWSEELQTPIVVWLAGLFNPMSYLTAIKQVTARAGGLPLDEMELKTDVLNTKNIAD
jgi:dynein heavy chain